MTVSRGKAAIALRYVLAPVCIGIAVLLHVSPVSPLFHPMGLFIIGVLAAAWFGGAGPGVFAAFLSAVFLPHLIATTYPLSVSYPLLAGFFDLPRFISLGLTGAAVGWGRSSYWRAESALRERNRAEQAQRQSQQRYERVLDGAEVGDWEWDVVNGHYFVSARMRQMLEMPLNLHFASREDFLAHVPFHPADREFYVEASKRNIAIGPPTVEHEYRVVRQNGAVRWMRVRGKSTRNAQGVVTHFSGSLVDITERKLAAQTLQESEERFSLAIEASAEGYFDINLDTDELFTSERFNEIHGFAPGTRFGTRAAYVKHLRFYGNDAETFYAAAKATLAKDAPERYQFEYRIVRPSGEMRWVKMRGKVTRDAEGRARRRTGVVADITEAKLAEEALRASQERYALAVAGSEDGVWDCDFAAGRVFVSARARELVGMPSGPEVLPLDEFFTALPIHPEDASVRTAAMQAHLAGKTPAYDGEFRLRQPDGVYRWRRIHGLCLRDAYGNPHRMAGSISDVDARRRAEEALRLSEERSALALEVTEEGHFDWNVQTDHIFASATALRVANMPQDLEYRTRGDITSRLYYHPEDWARIEEEWRAALAGRGSEHEFEYRILRGEEVRSIRSRWKVFRDADGVAQRVIGIDRDVTEMRKMEQALSRAQRLEAMGALAGGIAHDFNNILGAILGYGEMAMRDARHGTRLRRDVESIMAAGERGRALVDRVLAFSRSGVAERVPVHVEAVVQEALDQVAASLPKDVTITSRLRARRAAILGDSTQVHQVIMNLASNAVQSMPEGGVLRVSLDMLRVEAPRAALVGTVSPGEHIVLTVTDAGTGIGTGVLERMFDPFFTTKEVGVGSGLGLSLVHGIVISVGGAIDVATQLGKGSTFTVYLPRSGDAPAEAADESRPLPCGEGERVLVVDDEEPLVRLATETLERLGYAPIGFTSSTAALAAFRADPRRFDVVLTDERMPGLSGSALIREMREIRYAIPVVLMSGYIGTENVDADVVVIKPLSARDLAASMARALHP